jgi:cytochrome c oxidase assembly protein subunit 19
MAKDDFKNLGFHDDKPAEEAKKDDGADKGVKGEIRW